MGSTHFYQIDILGPVSPGLQDWFSDLVLETLPDRTRLSGFLPDQSALLGVLDVIHNLGLTLLCVECPEIYPLKPGAPAEGKTS